MTRVAVGVSRPRRVLLAIYTVALLALLLFPIGGTPYVFLGIGVDKYVHVLMFAGLAELLRWNLSTSRHAVLIAVLGATLVAVATEIAQGLVVYRSAELWDMFAGALGAVLGATTMDRILSSPEPDKAVGFIVAILGLMVAALFILADVLGIGDDATFGPLQIAGTTLGAIITVGGISVFLNGFRRNRGHP